MNILRRAIFVATGYIAAAWIGSLTLVGVVALVMPSIGTDGPLEVIGKVILLGSLATPLVLLLAAFPSVILIGISELFRLRSVVFFVPAGIAAALFSQFIGFARQQNYFSDGTITEFVALLLAGALAGTVYWAVAGRRVESQQG